MLIPFYIDQEGFWRNQQYSLNVLCDINNCQANSEKQPLPFSYSSIDCWFPVVHGQFGEDGQIQQQLEKTELPYIGSDARASSLCYDKIASRQKARISDICQPEYVFFNYDDSKPDHDRVETIIQEIGLPCFIKPAQTGSSIGISRVMERKKINPALKMASIYDNQIIAEKAVENSMEYEIAFIGNRKKRFSIPGTIEYEDEFYTTAAKYSEEQTKLRVAVELQGELKERIYSAAKRMIELFAVKDLGRVDFLYNKKNDKLYWNEINTIPGFTEKSMFPFLWKEEGLEFQELINYILTDGI